VTPKLEASAKASAKLKAPDVTRARSRTWRALLSPLVEFAGRKGEEQRHKRRLQRLQYELEEAALREIIFRARQRLSKDVAVIKPVPMKFIVPFLEQASLEEPDSTLVDLWANLLVSASEDFNPHYTHFTSIISRLSGAQGQILKELTGTESSNTLQIAVDDMEDYYSSHAIEEHFSCELKKADVSDDDSLCEFVQKFFYLAGLEVVHVSAENNNTKECFDIIIEYSRYEDTKGLDYSILEAVGLARMVQTKFFDVEKWSVRLIYYYMTNLGLEFAKACKIVT
jgi:Abortive infection alpha